MSEPGLWDGILARGAVRAEVDDGAWLQAMLDVEAALARVQGSPHADSIAGCCQAELLDAGRLGAEAARVANPVVPLVRAVRESVEPDAAADVHRGATSQDILDTAAMLVAHRALGPLLDDLGASAGAAAALAERHRETAMAGRTLLQQAVPITFGLKAAGWMTGLDAAAARLAEVRRDRLAVQLGGAAGTLAAFGGDGPRLLTDLAADLGLSDPVLPWHTDRTRIAELAAALGEACGAAGKVAGDVVLLAQTEVAEVSEGDPGAGGSSAMPHKHNPVAAVSTLACADQAPGLVATLLRCMVGEHERAAGAWQAEWRPLSDLLRLTGSAAAWLRHCLEHLEVEAERMTDNLRRGSEQALREHADAKDMLDVGDAVAAAAALVDRALESR
ncbi:MAG: lyase family protein [Solirubrobacteraceae bacterium]